MSIIEFSARFNQLEGLLQAFAIQLTKNKADAEDLVQETAFKAFKYRNNYQPQTNLRAWLITIMRNTFINDYRKQKRRQALHEQTDQTYFFDARNQTVENMGESNMTLEELQTLLEKLEEWARIPFLMYYQGFKYEEIARELDVPLGTVKSRIFFARKRLKSMIGELYKTPTTPQAIKGSGKLRNYHLTEMTSEELN